MNKFFGFLATLGVIVLIALGIFFATPFGRGVMSTYRYKVQKVDEATNYETIKKVEDTCRAMISSYESDKLVYEQYKDNKNEEKQSWAEQAKMRANKTAVSYNNYILKNSFVLGDNIPSDIYSELATID